MFIIIIVYYHNIAKLTVTVVIEGGIFPIRLSFLFIVVTGT